MAISFGFNIVKTALVLLALVVSGRAQCTPQQDSVPIPLHSCATHISNGGLGSSAWDSVKDICRTKLAEIETDSGSLNNIPGCCVRLSNCKDYINGNPYSAFDCLINIGKYAACVQEVKPCKASLEAANVANTELETTLSETAGALAICEGQLCTNGDTCQPASTCATDLTDCQTSLDGANVENSELNFRLNQATSDFADCNSNLATCTSQLCTNGETCQAASTCPADLTTCQASLDAANGDVASCESKLCANGETCQAASTCPADLTACQTSLATSSTDLSTCQTTLTAASTDLQTCQNSLNNVSPACPPACGVPNKQCCATGAPCRMGDARFRDSVCDAGTCRPCGGLRQRCCPGNTRCRNYGGFAIQCGANGRCTRCAGNQLLQAIIA